MSKFIAVVSILAAVTQGLSCLNLRATAPFNAVVFGDYQGSSDVEGTIAVGGNAIFASGFSVGDKVPSALCTKDYTVVGGSLQWPQGQNYFGNIAVGNLADSNVNSGVLNPGCQVRESNSFPSESKAEITEMSRQFAAMTETGVTASIDISMNLMLQFTGKPIEVINIQNGSYFGGQVKSISAPFGLATDALIIFNILGDSASIKDMEMESFANLNVVFNFPQATQLDISGVAVRGSVFAPLANIVEAQGVIYGRVFVQSLTGPIQINVGNVQVCSSGAITPSNTVSGQSVIQPTSNVNGVSADEPKKCRIRPASTPMSEALPLTTESSQVSGVAVLPSATTTSQVLAAALVTPSPFQPTY